MLLSFVCFLSVFWVTGQKPAKSTRENNYTLTPVCAPVRAPVCAPVAEAPGIRHPNEHAHYVYMLGR